MPRVTGTCQECGNKVSYGGSTMDIHMSDGAAYRPATQGHRREDRCPGSYKTSVETAKGDAANRPITRSEQALSRSMFGVSSAGRALVVRCPLPQGGTDKPTHVNTTAREGGPMLL